jgi:hypothetical protein
MYKRTWTRRGVVLGAIVLVGGGGLGLAAGVSQATSSSAPQAPPIRPAPAGTPPEKAAGWQQMEKARVAHAGSPVVAPSPPSSPMKAYFQLGISDDRQGPFTSSQFFGVNSWSGESSASTIEVVVAGGQPSDASDPFHSTELAAVFVYTESTDPAAGTDGTTAVGIFGPTPDPGGEFSITAVNGGVLTLALSGGSGTYYFNIATHAFS